MMRVYIMKKATPEQIAQKKEEILKQRRQRQ